ncbi:hypothetical protein QOZ80_2AG0129230 [Eleusine coracana subsp. coracana]|nr:hypothetical protein QOZ80_2AG0129230 [Eleusine coracana subsp. coracana]
MNSGSYFTNLMSNRISNPDVYAAGRPDHNPLPDLDVYDVVQPDGNPLPNPESMLLVNLMTTHHLMRDQDKVFAGCFSKIEARNHSGWSVDDKIVSVCAMFKADDKTHRNFPYMHCWKILKDKPKWMDRCKHTPNLGGKRQKTTDNASPSATTLSLQERRRRSRGYGNVQAWKQWSIL